MTDPPLPALSISTGLDGGFLDIVLRESTLATAVAAGGARWSEPLLLSGPDVAAEIDALKRLGGEEQWLDVHNFRDLVSPQRRGLFEEMEGRLDPRFYEHLTGGARARLGQILKGTEPFETLVGFIARGPTGKGVLGLNPIGEDLVSYVERLCNTQGIIIPWQMRNTVLPAFVLAVWKRHRRPHPLVLHAQKPFGIPTGDGVEIATAGVGFDALMQEAERALGVMPKDVEKAYRVWQLSKNEDTSKPQATTPRFISLDTARSFLKVLTRARTEQQSALVAAQKPAPVMFALEEDTVGLKHGVSAADPDTIIKASAGSLGRRVDRLKHDGHFPNIVPSSTDMLKVAAEILDRMKDGNYSDADIVELGLEFNALQWHVQAVREDLSDVSIGELTGLFATATLFLGRFAVWQQYAGTKEAEGRPHDGIAAFDLALQLLRSAREKPAFLTAEASERIEGILDRTPETTTAPPLREGLVRSGENLAAVTAEGLSHVVVTEAKDFGGKVKDKAYSEASDAIVAFAKKNGPALLQLGKLRDWPWLSWLDHLIP